MTEPDALVIKLGSADWRDDPDALMQQVAELTRPLVFTNGCFDILHRGHVTYLTQAAELGRSLVVAINDDASVEKQNKGEERPINGLEDRAILLAALASVDLVVPFGEPTPLSLITLIRPDILVKGGDWAVDDIVGASEVRSWNGSVYSIPFEVERSTTALLKRIRGK